MIAPFRFIANSFRRKMIAFVLIAVFFTAFALFSFMMYNFNAITTFSLEQNSKSLESTVEDYLNKYVVEKAGSTWLQIKAAQDNLAVLGKTAQKIVDNYDDIRANAPLLNLPLFRTNLHKSQGALTNGPEEAVNTFIQPPIASSPAALEMLRVSGLLNLSIGAVFEANINYASVYFVGDKKSPVNRLYPNRDLVSVLGPELNNIFWRDYFAENVGTWSHYYQDSALQKAIPSPVTVEAPYADAAGQGMMVTMFYPLWNQKTKAFAGAVGADITLAKIIDNVLSIRVAKTGFAFLMNGKGNIIAMPEIGMKLFQVNLKETKQGSLSFFSGSLADSRLDPVKELAKAMLSGRNTNEGLKKLDLSKDQVAKDRNIVVWASLPALYDNQYGQDAWKIVISVPEAEIFEALNATHSAITAESLRMSLISILILVAFLVGISFISFKVSDRTTRDLQTLAEAAEQVSAKNYDIDLRISTHDEIGQLGRVFTNMARQIKEYTVDLEGKVAERTADLVKANDQITQLNAQLKGENLRLGAELDVARRLQMMVLPSDSEIAAIKGLDIACYMRPADEVGGDYYDILKIGDTVYLGIGDVTGHGLSAGVIMLMAQTALMTLSQSGEQDIKQIMHVLNKVLYNNILRINEDKNMTLAVLQYQDGAFTLVGQHESVIICRADGTVEVIDTMDLGLPVGLEEDIRSFIGTARIVLETGDTMVLYTDGVTEAENNCQEQYTIEGLKRSLARNHQRSAHEILDHINAELQEHIAGSKIYDDISVVVIKKKGE